MPVPGSESQTRPKKVRNTNTIAEAQSSFRDRAIATITSAGTYRMEGLKWAGVRKSSRIATTDSTMAAVIAAAGDTREEILSMIIFGPTAGGMGKPTRLPLFLPVAPIDARPDSGKMAGRHWPLRLAQHQSPPGSHGHFQSREQRR